MTFETVVPELFERLPKLQARYRSDFAWLADHEPLPYSVFGFIVVPALEQAVQTGDLGTILPLCAFLEDVACAARLDGNLAGLLGIEVGKWLGWAAHEERLAPWLGPETKRICNYTPGLATQRRALKAQAEARTLRARLRSWLRKRA